MLASLTQHQQALLEQQQQQQRQEDGAGGGSLPGTGASSGGQWASLACLLRAAVGFAQRALSKADVAALFLSRKILLTEVKVGASGGVTWW